MKHEQKKVVHRSVLLLPYEECTDSPTGWAFDPVACFLMRVYRCLSCCIAAAFIQTPTWVTVLIIFGCVGLPRRCVSEINALCHSRITVAPMDLCWLRKLWPEFSAEFSAGMHKYSHTQSITLNHPLKSSPPLSSCNLNLPCALIRTLLFSLTLYDFVILLDESVTSEQ